MIVRSALAAGLGLVAAACGASEPAATTVQVETVALFPDDPGRRGLDALSYAGGLVLTSTDPRFGGWSAMEVSADGRRLLAVSDRAYWMTARLVFGANGDLTGLVDPLIAPMLDEEGAALSGRRADAEGLAPLGEGRYAVSFERDHRIWAYDLGEDWSGVETALPQPLAAPPGADRLRNNAGLEALAATEDAFWAAIEDPIVDGQPHTVWRYEGGDADGSTPPRAMALSLTPGFGLTGLTESPEGGLIVIERFWSRDIGNRVRIGVLDAERLSAGGATPVTPTPLGQLEPDMTVDNIEAVALAEIDGAPRLFVMSDDNYNAAQRTLLLSFTLPPP